MSKLFPSTLIIHLIKWSVSSW